MPNDVNTRVARAIAEKVFPGCVIGVVRKNGEREVRPFGHFTYDADAAAVRVDTIYDVASVTKAIPTAALILTFIEEGKLWSADKVTQYIPELQNDYGATIEDLLTYRVQGSQLSKLKNKTAVEILAHVFEKGFSGPPAEPVYTNLPALLLGLVAERIGGEKLHTLAQKHFFFPLNMKQTSFFPIDPSEVAPTEVDERGVVCALPHDESAYVFARARRVAGHAGLFSSAPDTLNFLEMLLSEPAHPVVKGGQKGWGWQLNQQWFMGIKSSAGTFGKTGFTGTSVVVDVERDIGFVILSNRTYPKRPPDAASIHSAINAFRSDIADIFFSAQGGSASGRR